MEIAAPAMVRIPAGEFLMGSEEGFDNERPVHPVWVDAFDLAVYSVTNVEYALFLAATGHDAPRFWDDPSFNDPRQPVVGMTWDSAVACCAWLSAALGGCYRLPTEAEREKASRGGLAGARYPWGDDEPAWVDRFARGRDRQSGSWPVGTGEPNGYGLYNMGDNLHEWCADYYDAEYYSARAYLNPQGLPDGTRRVARGGAWRHGVKVTRCARRSSLPPDRRFSDFGFRVARTVAADHWRQRTGAPGWYLVGKYGVRSAIPPKIASLRSQ